MSNFVSAGTIDNPTPRDDEWLAAQQELESNRRLREQDARRADGKSLYDILQANKAAKQEAFEESIRLKNQFRALDDDEVEFLDAVLEATREREEAVRRETSERLEVFRRARGEAERVALEGGEGEGGEVVEERWGAGGKKRRRGGGGDIKGLRGFKVRKVEEEEEKEERSGRAVGHAKEMVSDASNEKGTGSEPPKVVTASSETMATAQVPSTTGSAPAATPKTASSVNVKAGLGLASYSSDEDD